jgi:transcriptional regulator with XRE-family HTH domain
MVGVSHLARSLKALLKRNDWTQAEYAVLCGLAQNEISYYIRDRHYPTRDNLCCLLKGAGEDDVEVATAYMRDVRDWLPEKVRGRIEITVKDSPSPQ